MRLLLILFIIIGVSSCKEETVVKPSAQLRLEYPVQEYEMIDSDCAYGFMKNVHAAIEMKANCGMNISYPKMNATIYLSYREIEDNLDSLLYDAQKLTYDHTIKAQGIIEQPRVDSVSNVFGMLYMINGNAATQSQFYVTDSVQHFVNGAVYFEAKPNFDSLYPAVMYLREDVRRIMETIRWKNK